MKIGQYEIHAIETCRFGLDGGAMFGVVPKNLWSKVYHPGDEQNRIPMAARLLLLKSDERTILIDTGNGNKLSDKLVSIYGIDTSEFSLEKGLNDCGVSALDITDVILTHLHFDHVGGATSINNGELVPTFQNATYYVQKEHYNWAMNPTEKDRASFMKENYEPLYMNGMLELIDGDGEILPSINAHCLHGHTKALQMITISDAITTLAFPADLMPTHSHVPVPYGMGYDNFPLTTIEEKKKWLPRMADEQWLICFEHDAFVPFGRIQATDKGFVCAEKIMTI
jgi:glyoxylase-like metal-dependent hydrolase (beta-lactamase superfamily II)